MKELCVRCGKEMEYDINTPVTVRRYFIEGSGQLCEACFQDLYAYEVKMSAIAQKMIGDEHRRMIE